MRKIIYLWVGLLSIFLGACGHSPVNSSAPKKQDVFAGFVTIQNGQFYRQDKPYYFVGTNLWYGSYLGASEAGRARLLKELDSLKSLGITNVRVLAAAEQTSLKMAVNPGLHSAPGQYDENLFKGLDLLLDELAKRDMVAVIYLNNYWQWSGGMAQYMAWLTGEVPFDPDTTGDWNGFMQNSAKFYRSAQAQEWYHQLIQAVILRTNSISGKIYRDDPAIMAWQLANEPRPGSDSQGRPFYPHYKTWIVQTADFIKSLDAHHLVSTGSEGAMGSLRDITLYHDAHGHANIDYLTLHMWPKNWSWYDHKNAEATYPEALAKSKAYLLEHLQVAKALGKPLVLEEFGLERDGGEFRTDVSTVYRDQYFQDIFNFIEHQIGGSAGLMGSNFWAWGGEGAAQSPDFIWRSGDPFTGDPPQEPQGLNSVFGSDQNTLKILKKHAQRLSNLSP